MGDITGLLKDLPIFASFFFKCCQWGLTTNSLQIFKRAALSFSPESLKTLFLIHFDLNNHLYYWVFHVCTLLYHVMLSTCVSSQSRAAVTQSHRAGQRSCICSVSLDTLMWALKWEETRSALNQTHCNLRSQRLQGIWV